MAMGKPIIPVPGMPTPIAFLRMFALKRTSIFSGRDAGARHAQGDGDGFGASYCGDHFAFYEGYDGVAFGFR